MVKTTITKHLNLLALAAIIFHLAACSFQASTPRPIIITSAHRSTIHQSRLLSASQTHRLLQKWASNHYKSPTDSIIQFTSKHPLAPSFHSITSGRNISTFAHTSKGIGLPVIVQTKPNNFKKITNHAYQLNTHIATLVAIQAGTTIRLTLLDPLTTKIWNNHPLASQDSLRIDHLTSLPGNSSLKFKGLFRPDKYKHLQGFYLSRPYDEKRIPIIMIHGIVATPESFIDMAEAIEQQPDLYQKYQIWHYYYPTGTPWLATAHEFRSTFRRLIKKLDPQHRSHTINQTIIIAHSMGGLISRLSLSTPGTALDNAYLSKTDPTKITQSIRQQLQPYFHFKPLTEPNRIIFLATPHRGSRLAKGLIGWTADRLITLPKAIITLPKHLIKPHKKTPQLSSATPELLKHNENAVNQLRPDNPAIIALNNMPMRKNLTTFSIIGDIAPFKLRFCTDGVVSYRSAHLPSPTQEFIVHANHDIADEDASIQTVINILRR